MPPAGADPDALRRVFEQLRHRVGGDGALALAVLAGLVAVVARQPGGETAEPEKAVAVLDQRAGRHAADGEAGAEMRFAPGLRGFARRRPGLEEEPGPAGWPGLARRSWGPSKALARDADVATVVSGGGPAPGPAAHRQAPPSSPSPQATPRVHVHAHVHAPARRAGVGAGGGRAGAGSWIGTTNREGWKAAGVARHIRPADRCYQSRAAKAAASSTGLETTVPTRLGGWRA